MPDDDGASGAAQAEPEADARDRPSEVSDEKSAPAKTDPDQTQAPPEYAAPASLVHKRPSRVHRHESRPPAIRARAHRSRPRWHEIARRAVSGASRRHRTGSRRHGNGSRELERPSRARGIAS